MRAISTAKAAFIALTTTLALSSPLRSETTCADDDFHRFLAEFLDSPSSQKAMSADRLTMTTVVKRDSGTLARDTQTLSKDDLDWPILPTLTEINRQDFRVKIYQSTPFKIELNAFTEEHPEIFLIWYFEKNPCWTFVGHMDGTQGRWSHQRIGKR